MEPPFKREDYETQGPQEAPGRRQLDPTVELLHHCGLRRYGLRLVSAGLQLHPVIPCAERVAVDLSLRCAQAQTAYMWR